MYPLGIYLHIPFCLSKCPYCDFYSLPYDEDLVNQYVSQLIRAIADAPAGGQPVDSIYFGGGTPVLLGERLLSVLQAVYQHFDVSSDCEITLEANPAAMTFETLCKLHQGGFNRISMGVQSASDSELQRLGRRHNFAQAVESVQLAQSAGFENISVDLMLGTPQQTSASVDHFIQTFASLGVQHISGYLLKIEPGTPFARQQIQNICPDEDQSADLYLHTVDQMLQHGYAQYEISNFAKPGFESRHNLKYWRCQQYLGIGPAAHSFLDGKRFFFPRDLSGFLSAPNVWSLCVQDGSGGDLEEVLMLRLRLCEGIRLSMLRQQFELDTSALEKRAAFLQKQGLVYFDGDLLCLTAQGFLISNSLIVDLLECC